jgi:hypothetical protein
VLLLLLQNVCERGRLLRLLLLGRLGLLACKELGAHLDLSWELRVITDCSSPACLRMVQCSEHLIQHLTRIMHLTQFNADGSST